MILRFKFHDPWRYFIHDFYFYRDLLCIDFSRWTHMVLEASSVSSEDIWNFGCFSWSWRLLMWKHYLSLIHFFVPLKITSVQALDDAPYYFLWEHFLAGFLFVVCVYSLIIPVLILGSIMCTQTHYFSEFSLEFALCVKTLLT